MIRALLAAALLAAPSLGRAMAFSVGRGESSSGVAVNVVRAYGQIGAAEWRSWMYAVSQLDPGLDTLIVVDSPGGAVPGGFFLLNKVEEFLARQSANGRKVAILNARDCSSMCIPFFYYFERRYSVPDARFGFHGISLGGIGYDMEQTGLYLGKFTAKANERGDGRVAAWLDRKKAEGVFSSADLTPLKARVLAEQDSGLLDASGLVESERQAVDRLVLQ